MRAASLVPSLPGRAWLVLGGDLLSAAGSGLTMAFFVVYLNRVRGLDLAVAGLALSTVAVASFAGNVIGGSLADRIGSRRALMAGLAASAVGAAWFASVRSTPAAFGAAAVIGLGASVAWPAADALLASVVDEDQRSHAFALRHATMNLGFGIGGIVAAVVVDLDSPSSFELLYVIDAVTFGAFIALLATLLRGVGNRQPVEEDAAAGAGGYRAVVADRTFVYVWLITALVVLVGYAQYEAALPPYATGTGGISAQALALVFAANTFGVAVFQLVVLRVVGGHRRSTAIMLAAAFLALAWCIAIAAGHAGGGAPAVIGFAAAMTVVALFETLLAPTLAPIANDLAPDHLRGRYNGVFVLAYTTGFAAGPALAGLFLGAGYGTAFFVLLIAGAGLAAAGGLLLRRRLAPELDLIPAVDTAMPVPQTEAA